MKKKLLLVVILTLILAIVLPTQILAEGKNPTKFAASGPIGIVSFGDTQIQKMVGPLIFEITQSEVVTVDVVSSPDWPALIGASMVIEADANAVINMKQGTIRGTSLGTVIVTGADGSSTMEGNYRAKLQGEFHFDMLSGYILYDYMDDGGQLELEGISGVFADMKVSMKGSAILLPQGDTLAGNMNLTGKYTQ
ncbi:MAG: hypothetical protein PHY28_05230 [Dehalococcoidales bacterium]|nr:hypothetical protein [Dehalococcoidales bacterium]